MAEKPIKAPDITIPLGSRKEVPFGKYMHLDISAQAQIKNCLITPNGSEKPDSKSAVTTAAQNWFKGEGKALQFEGKPFGDFAMDKPHAGKDGFDVKLHASSKAGELIFDLKFVDLTDGKQAIQAPSQAWPKYKLNETVKSFKVTGEIFPVIVAVGHPQYKEILVEAGVKAMKTQLGKQAAQALAKALVRYGLNDLAAVVESFATEAAAAEGAGVTAVVLTPPVTIALAASAVILSGAWAWSYHCDTETITGARGAVGNLASELWKGFQQGVLAGSPRGADQAAGFAVGKQVRQQMLADIEKQDKHASPKAIDEAVRKAAGQIFANSAYHEALHKRAQKEVWEDCKIKLAPYWLNPKPNRLKEAYINVFGSASGYEDAIRSIKAK